MQLPQQTETPDMEDISKQRASKACNRCRVKKARCSGGYPCSRCKSSDALCIFGYPKRSKRKHFPEHYVRTLEMQQFKLVAGLQTMYFMLLAANSWPGSRLPESKGNPFVHDILARIGILDPENDRGIEMEIGEMSDGQQTDSDQVSTAGSPEPFPLQQGFELLPEPCSEQSSASSDCSAFQAQLLSSASETRITTHPWQPEPVQPQPSFPQPLPMDFGFRPQNVEATNWDAFDYPEPPEPWWQPNFQTLQAIPSTSIGSVPGISDVNTAAEHTLGIQTTCDSSTYLVDPGVYTCDFDVD
ncbi:hypothetical protein KCU78_g2419, partial [Aureobasidium melanogenum]